MTPGPASRPGPAGGGSRHEAAAPYGSAILLVAPGRAASAAAAPNGGGGSGSRSGSDGSSVLGPRLVPLSRKLQDGHSLPRAARNEHNTGRGGGNDEDDLARRRRNASRDGSPSARAPVAAAYTNEETKGKYRERPPSSTRASNFLLRCTVNGRRLYLFTTRPVTGSLAVPLARRGLAPEPVFWSTWLTHQPEGVWVLEPCIRNARTQTQRCLKEDVFLRTNRKRWWLYSARTLRLWRSTSH